MLGWFCTTLALLSVSIGKLEGPFARSKRGGLSRLLLLSTSNVLAQGRRRLRHLVARRSYARHTEKAATTTTP